jgi:hypothetical protein
MAMLERYLYDCANVVDDISLGNGEIATRKTATISASTNLPIDTSSNVKKECGRKESRVLLELEADMTAMTDKSILQRAQKDARDWEFSATDG